MSSSDTQSTRSFTSYTDYSDNCTHYLPQQIHSTDNHYQKKRNASHIHVNQPSKRRKLNRTFDQYDIKDYDNYLNCILTIIRMTRTNHKAIKRKYKSNMTNDTFLNTNKLQKYEKTIVAASNGSTSLHYNVLLDTINKCIQHIPIKYQEKVAIASDYKAIFDTYLSKKYFQMPHILSVKDVYYEYLCQNNRQREKKRMKKVQKQKKLLQIELKDIKQKYNELLSKITIQNKRIEKMRKDKKAQDSVISELHRNIIDGKNNDKIEHSKDMIITTLKNVLKQLNEKNGILVEENTTFEHESIALSQENFVLKQRVTDLEYQLTISNNMLDNINAIKKERSMQSNERPTNEINDDIQHIQFKQEHDSELIEGDNNNLMMLDNIECTDYSEDNDIDNDIDNGIVEEKEQ
eukprot:153606_1